MNIGREQKEIYVEPVQLPEPLRQPIPEPNQTPIPVPERESEKVPA